jgi:hypothetical protein
MSDETLVYNSQSAHTNVGLSMSQVVRVRWIVVQVVMVVPSDENCVVDVGFERQEFIVVQVIVLHLVLE